MPSPPKLSNILRKIWRIEVQIQFDAKQFTYPASYIGISGKITVELNREEKHPHKKIAAAHCVNVFECPVHIRREQVSNNKLPRITDDDKCNAIANLSK